MGDSAVERLVNLRHLLFQRPPTLHRPRLERHNPIPQRPRHVRQIDLIAIPEGDSRCIESIELAQAVNEVAVFGGDVRDADDADGEEDDDAREGGVGAQEADEGVRGAV